MKKLLMFLGVCLVAGLAQAASVTWNYSIGTFFDPDWNTLENGTLTLTIGGTSYDPADIVGGAATGSLTGDFTGGETVSATLTAEFAGGTWTQTISDWTMPSVSGDPTQDNQGLATLADSIANGFIDQTLYTLPDDPAAAGWSDAGGGGIPEPTSGLLLLIGGSLLALRRKQK